MGDQQAAAALQQLSVDDEELVTQTLSLFFFLLRKTQLRHTLQPANNFCTPTTITLLHAHTHLLAKIGSVYIKYTNSITYTEISAR